MPMALSTLFDAANLFVLPFWLLMILLPLWRVSQRILASPWPFVALAGLYLYLFVGSITPESAAALSNPTLADIAQFFSQEQVAATGWVHFLVLDLFVGRWIYQQGLQQQIWTTHSLILCLFAGPLGLLSHLITAGITERLRSGSTLDGTDPAVAAPASPEEGITS